VFMNPLSASEAFDRKTAESLARGWWIGLLAGLISIVFGIVILTVDWSVESLSVFIGALFILEGIAWVMGRPLDGSARGWTLALGILSAVTGIVVIAWPEIGLLTLAIFFGAALVARGVAHIVGALANREVALWWLILVLGIIEIPVGIWALRRPGLTLAVLITLMGVWAIVQGIWECVVAFELRNLPRRIRARLA
jgi:uncharacterized membrane protein HdeD (DUF308 family)